MLDKRIENYQLQCFAMVAVYENMSKAAKQLHISQPSLSQTIRRLETEWGYPLFERTGNKISLNEDGKILLQAIRKSGRIMLDALRLTEERHEVSHGEIRVYMGCASMYLPELLQYLRRSEQKKMVYKIHQWQRDARKLVLWQWMILPIWFFWRINQRMSRSYMKYYLRKKYFWQFRQRILWQQKK